MIFIRVVFVYRLVRWLAELQCDRCYDFKKYFRRKNGEKMALLTRNKAKLCKNLSITLVF
jgi:hypothetical protein